MGNHKRLGAIVVVLGVLTVILAAFFFIILPYVIKPSVSLSLGSKVFNSTMAVTESDRARSWSSLSEISPDKALIMIFPTESKWKVWTNNIKMPVDIVWLDKDKTVIYIVKNAMPNNSGNSSFEPKKNAKYIIEIPSGAVNDASIKIGQSAKFDFDESGVE